MVRRTAQSTANVKSRREPTQTRKNSSGQRPTQVTTPSSQKFQARTADRRVADKRARQQSTPAVTAPVRLPQPRASSYSARQQPRQVVSAPVQKQYSSRPALPPQSSRNSGRSNSAPARRAPQRSTQKTSSHRNGSYGGGGKRDGGSRSKRQ
jgi:hypothetical protein